MSFDGMVTDAVARQLNEKLTGGKIEKIYQPESDEIIIHVRSGRENFMLYASANSGHARLHLINEKESNPQNPSAFCMLLRKHLQGGRIKSIVQKDSERIVQISVDTVNELGFSVSKKLIIEIMGKHSNIILIDAESVKIIDSIKRISGDVNRYRQLLPGQQYIDPPNHGKISYHDLSESQLIGFLDENPEDPAAALMNNIQGISPSMAEEIVFQAGQLSSSESGPEAKEFFEVLNRMVKTIAINLLNPQVYLNQDNVPVDFHVIPLTQKGDYFRVVNLTDVSEAIDYYYTNKASSNRIKQKSLDLTKAIGNNLNKLYLKKQRLASDLLNAENSQVFRLYGELLTANLHNFSEGAEKVQILNYYDNQQIEIALDPRLSPAQNAQVYYKKYNKSKTAIKEKNIQLVETNNEINYLESVLDYVEKADTVDAIEELRQELIEGGYLRKRKNSYKTTKSKTKLLTYSSSEGFKIAVGRNNKENDILTFKTASGKDIWFHTKDIPGSHVILFSEGKKVTEKAIYEAASLAAYHSKARESENVPVDYTQVRHVKKPSGAKPGMVIFVNNKTIFVNPSITLKAD
ncbi:MAG: Rqc2 family fibronectin-binding protein [Anaerovoracaceae bacterium]|jgi:predicted ribosome quality control (RQC) complex YloA/Tae2 family protein